MSEDVLSSVPMMSQMVSIAVMALRGSDGIDLCLSLSVTILIFVYSKSVLQLINLIENIDTINHL